MSSAKPHGTRYVIRIPAGSAEPLRACKRASVKKSCAIAWRSHSALSGRRGFTNAYKKSVALLPALGSGFPVFTIDDCVR